MTPPVLPQEICDEIMDLAKDCSQVMKACTLVCRDWLPRARTHLFHDFTFPPDSEVQLKVYSDEIMRERLWPFIRGMNASTLTPSLFTIVCRLRFSREWLTGISIKVPKLFSRLPFQNLTHFRLYDSAPLGQCDYIVDAESLTNFLARQSSLQSLIFGDNIYFSSDYEFHKMCYRIAQSANLHTLCIDGIHCLADRRVFQAQHLAASLPVIKSPPSLRIIKYSRDQVDTIKHFLDLHSFDASSLDKVVVTHCLLADVAYSLWRIFKYCASTVTYLTLEISYCCPVDRNQSREVLDKLVNLTYFELKILREDYSPADAILLKEFFELCLPSLQNLSRFIVAIVSVSWVIQCAFFDESLDTFFSALPNMSNPRLESIIVYLPVGEKELAESVMTSLPKTCGRGLLDVRLGRETDPFNV
ncbi:hypothetical protein VKT23_016032 [Stygiomarasmius scandens]|uniref:F-box domain-containing protein n=1 Tax=Marasmiellus scandens TaxID=2682957 RepID=A0ABR1IWH3_9AGAR